MIKNIQRKHAKVYLLESLSKQGSGYPDMLKGGGLMLLVNWCNE